MYPGMQGGSGGINGSFMMQSQPTGTMPMPMSTMPMPTGPMGTGPIGTMPMPMGTMPMGTMPMGTMPTPFQTGPMGAMQMPSQSFQTARSMRGVPPPPSTSTHAFVPTMSGAWQPRVSYRLLEGDESREAAGELPVDRDELIRYCQAQDDKIQELKMKAKNLRSKQHGDHDQWAKRVEDLEAHVLSAKLNPVNTGAEVIHNTVGHECGHSIPPHLVPNGLLSEMRDRTSAEELFEDMTPWEEEQYWRQMDLNMESMALGLPPVQSLGLPEGAKIVDIRLVEAGHGSVLRRVLTEQRDRMLQKPPPLPVPTVRGRVQDSNFVLTPSPLHPVGPAAQMGLLKNLYPIDRAPMSYENVFESTWPGAQEAWYTTYSDYFDARKFPAVYQPEVTYERDVDRGRTVRSTTWCSEPRGDPMAALGVDVNGDGFADVVVVGKDKNKDGIPDVLQVNPAIQISQNVCSKFFGY